MTRFRTLLPMAALAALIGFGGIAHAQTTTPYTTGTTATTPGTPNTGAGGDAPLNLAVLIGSAGVALAGVAYASRLQTR